MDKNLLSEDKGTIKKDLDCCTSDNYLFIE